MGIWYDKGLLCSHNALFNFTLGARGTGKTFCFKLWALTKTTQTVWVRRHEEDLHSKIGAGLLDGDKFLKDVVAEGYIDPAEYRQEANSILRNYGTEEFPDWRVQIQFIALKTSSRVKSQSYHDTDMIVYDEFLERNQSKYIKNEAEVFLELYETVNRLRLDGRKEVRVFFLANNISFINPYFAYWNILPFEGRFKTFKNGLICVESYTNQAFVNAKKATKFGQLIDGTKYGDYAIDNVVWMDDEAFISDVQPNSVLRYNLHVDGVYYGVWFGKDWITISRKYNLEALTYAPLMSCEDGEYPFRKTSQVYKGLEQCYLYQLLRFEDVMCKNVFFTMMQTSLLEL